MSVYEALIEEGKQPHCERPNPCCEEPCDEPSFWDLLPQCRLNWIALGLAAFAIGFGLIGLGYLNIGVIRQLPIMDFPVIDVTNPTLLAQGIRLTLIFLGVILVFAWFLFKACSDDWKTVVIGSLIGASGFPIAAIGLLYFSVAIFPPLPIPSLISHGSTFQSPWSSQASSASCSLPSSSTSIVVMFVLVQRRESLSR